MAYLRSVVLMVYLCAVSVGSQCVVARFAQRLHTENYRRVGTVHQNQNTLWHLYWGAS